jgi:DmsE family decaheme c-type cytochrome
VPGKSVLPTPARTRRAIIAGLVSLIFAWAMPSAVADEAREAAPADPAYSELGADSCLSCHKAEAMLAIFRTPHGQAADPESPVAQLQCESCHGPGGDHAGRRAVQPGHQPVVTFGTDAATPVREQDAVCLGCHQSDVHLAWSGSVHERNETGCVGCHSLHLPRDPATLRAQQNEVCFACHRQQRADTLKPSAHPLRTDDGARVAALVCSDCHAPHQASSGPAQLNRPTVNELCFDCHAEYRGPVIFDHAPVSEDCSLCHQPHGSIHAALLTRPAPLLCQSCHSQRGHPSLSFTEQSLPGGTPSSMVLGRSCTNCHTQVHGSNHPSGYKLMR